MFTKLKRKNKVDQTYLLSRNKNLRQLQNLRTQTTSFQFASLTMPRLFANIDAKLRCSERIKRQKVGAQSEQIYEELLQSNQRLTAYRQSHKISGIARN